MGLTDIQFIVFILARLDKLIDSSIVAERLIDKFGSVRGVVLADIDSLCSVEGITFRAAAAIKFLEQLHIRVANSDIPPRLPLGDYSALKSYLRNKLSHLGVEELWIIFLDSNQSLIRDELLGRGTVDRCSIYPREVVRRALDAQASSIILVHNHPSRVAEPSREDVALTRSLLRIVQQLDIDLRDHMIVAGDTCVSLRELGYFAPEVGQRRA